MNRKQFKQSISEKRENRDYIKDSKGKAYSGDVDVFANFKRNAEKAGLTKYQIWLVYFNKHIDAITNSIKDNPDNPVDETESMQGRIDDAINYLELLEGMLEEDNNVVVPFAK